MEHQMVIPVALFLSYFLVTSAVQEQAKAEKGVVDCQHVDTPHVKKTIQTKDGDVFDCIDINQQPAFRNPLLKDHVIQMEPSSYPSGSHPKFSSINSARESHLPIIACPSGTVPILQHGHCNNLSSLSFVPTGNGDIGAELAGIRTLDEIYGAKISITINEPKVRGNEDRTASWTVLGSINSSEAIGAGSIVWPIFSGDNFVRFHITWAVATQNYRACYNHLCPGFVQVSSVGLGGRLQPVSVYDGPQYTLDLLFRKDPTTNNWWIGAGPECYAIGYWPSSIFTGMKDKATGSFSGGLVDGPTYKSNPSPMGSGHFANEGYGKAARISNLRFVDAAGHYFTPDNKKAISGTTREECYTVDSFGQDSTSMHVFFGGPGDCNK